jgi:excisionase family DNA binding protein
MMSGTTLFTVPEAAAQLKVGRSTIYELLKNRELESVKIGRCTRIPSDSVTTLVERLRKPLT